MMGKFCPAQPQVNKAVCKECSAYWKEGGLESPMPPVLSAGGGGSGGGGGEGWDGVSTGGTTATGGSAAGVSEETNCKKKRNREIEQI